MARISLTPPRTLINRVAAAYSKRQYGAVMDPLNAMAHNRKVLLSNARFEMSLAKWKSLDPQLKQLAVMAASHRIGCSWCTDFGYWLAHSAGIDEAKLRDVPQWRDSSRFTELERQVLEYAEAMSGEMGEVTDELVAALRSALGEQALVELTMMIAVENQRSRFNSALGLTSQGFAERCEVRL
ncbi:carboxymuconolactone decarboxylase family protein [Epidermidibacterium keratini]|uniref:Carboxymuconolactone decarboxylase family protein n=1 Tax=Epidermidibacterium keratini TaxID=1891644 RepID=A0A7L4YQ53_9ACTN|nr:carboxymuconolactone decarboxylase family protein [Epidermidibacterium keratini]QHC01043.1 carboxymuconolactone decarboxylase family protein [Epidermidibacterium keratini]